MKKLFLIFLVFGALLSCNKQESVAEKLESGNTDYVQTSSLDDGPCISDEDFYAISEGLVGYLVDFRDTSIATMNEKMTRYIQQRGQYGDTICLSTEIALERENLIIGSI